MRLLQIRNGKGVGVGASQYAAPDGQSVVSAVVRDGEPRLILDLFWCRHWDDISVACSRRGWPAISAAERDADARFATSRFFRDPQTLVILGGGIGHKNSSLLDLRTGAQRLLAELPADFAIRDFDISASGSEIVFDRTQANSDLALIERTGL